MEYILDRLYLLLGISAIIFTLIGIFIGYSIGIWKCGNTYKKLFNNDKNKYI